MYVNPSTFSVIKLDVIIFLCILWSASLTVIMWNAHSNILKLLNVQIHGIKL